MLRPWGWEGPDSGPAEGDRAGSRGGVSCPRCLCRKSDIRGEGLWGAGTGRVFLLALAPQLLLPSSDKTVLLFNVNNDQSSEVSEVTSHRIASPLSECKEARCLS